ncbi:hypothetical protein C2G38_1992340, partial [Gigaspora rosea]
FRIIECIGIESAGSLGVCSLNEFRQYLNLKPYETFEDMNPDKRMAEILRTFYAMSIMLSFILVL